MQAGAHDLADCTTPLMHALTASAMECEVEVYFIGPGVRLLAQGAAQTVVASDSKKTLAVLLDDAKESGVRLYACTSAWKAHAPDGATLAPQCAGFGGAATYLGRALDAEWRVLTY
jgi:predicted peroxiredoxin